MRKTTKEILKNFNSYIDALKYAIDKWENVKETDYLNDKELYIRCIGEIGKLIHETNIKILGR